MIVCISINLKALKFALSRSKTKKYYSNVIPNLHNIIALWAIYFVHNTKNMYIYMIKIREKYVIHIVASRHCWMVQCWWHYVAVYWLSMRIRILLLWRLHTTPFLINPFVVNLNLSRIIKEILFAIKTKKFHKELITLVVIFLLPLS